MTRPPDPEALEMRRMLAWFKEQLPRHDLGDWAIRAQPLPKPIQIEGDLSALAASSWGEFRIEGHARCRRCGAQFDIPGIGNALAVYEESIPHTVEEMKKWVEREADKPCWGDVPKVRDGRSIAVLDSAAPRGQP